MLLEFSRFWSWKNSVYPTPTYFYLFEPSNRWALALDIYAEYKKNNKSITIISDNEPEFNREELSLILDILEKERTKIKQLGRIRYEFSTIITFICSFLLPTITLIEKMYLYS
jgi:hypothetical protein